MSECSVSGRMLQYLSPVRVVSRRIRGTISHQLHKPLYHHRSSTRLSSPLLACRVHGFMRISSCPYTSIRPIQLETRLVRSDNVFPVINSPMAVLVGPGDA
ncbi:hypothetical protein AVEN_100444-1 [Araneus ventricosus]|uniref:Uncharacterized protein n=1 Tax=Araneus ventricosus TaxID=182803 RepID=A0A4Y2D0B6_ARAVE|nr:hypothetical protein AVEN_100444-1 [Araneus ventricosus]